MDGPRAIVVGGSIGGLAAALALRDAGCGVEVYERSPRPLQGRGAGIVLHPATIRYLRERGSLDLEDMSVRSEHLVYLRRDGSVVVDRSVAYRFTWYSRLQQGLLDAFGAEHYHLASELVGFEDRDTEVTVTLQDGRMDGGDLLVGADGVHSFVRGRLFSDADPAYAGYVAWRGAVDTRQLPAATAAELRGMTTYHVGRSTHFLAYPIPGVEGEEAQLNWVWYRNVPEGGPLDDLMTGRDGTTHELSLPASQIDPAHRELLIADACAELPGVLAELVLACAEPFVQVIVDIEVPRMSVGRVCLVGDAAFAIRPHIAAGTAKAAADAWALGEHLREAAGDVVTALAAWEPAQRALAQRAQARSRDLGQRVQFLGTYGPEDPDVLYGLVEPGDSDIP